MKRLWNNESREKLVWGRALYIDSTQVNANADLDSLTPRFAVEARAAIQTHLSALFSEEESHQEQPTAATEVVAASIDATLTEGMTCAVPTPLSIPLSQAEHEELAQDNAARHDWIAQEGRKPREVHGHNLRTSDFKVSTTDPDATPMRLKGGGTHLGYHTRLSRRWRQSAHHPASPSNSFRSDG